MPPARDPVTGRFLPADGLTDAMKGLEDAVRENSRSQDGGGGFFGGGGDGSSGGGVSKRRKKIGKAALAAASVPLLQGLDRFAAGGSFAGGTQAFLTGLAGQIPVLGAATGADIAGRALQGAQAQLAGFAGQLGRAGIDVQADDLQQAAEFLIGRERQAALNEQQVANAVNTPENVARAFGSSVDAQADALVPIIQSLEATIEGLPDRIAEAIFQVFGR